MVFRISGLAESGCPDVPLCVCVSCCKQGEKRCRFERWSYVRLCARKSAMVSCPESFRCQRWSTVLIDEFSSVKDLRSVSGTSCYVVLIRLSIDTTLETGVTGFEEREVAVVLECLRDFVDQFFFCSLTALGPRPETIFLRKSGLEDLMDLARTDSPRRGDRNKYDQAKNRATAAAMGGRRRREACGATAAADGRSAAA
ncbi:TMV resistance protein N-like [Dorcoceras hygrometricum]|uniref:TMV resistance protein N-like n=1 Tax=Dorcoceras hygrometricum TaxID=472368 RepID=A0A2Z7ACC4_9LAMI|nr:TMV resistance protein N-like [Dorcoceras hygrometricum]